MVVEIPDTVELDLNPVTCWGHPTAEEMEESAKRRREAIPYYEILYVLNEWMWREAFAQAKAEHPDLVRMIGQAR